MKFETKLKVWLKTLNGRKVVCVSYLLSQEQPVIKYHQLH